MKENQKNDINEENLQQLSTDPSTNNSRKQIDNVIDSTGTKVLNKTGVPKPVAEQAIKKNGGTFSPNNLPANKIAKNTTRNAIAKDDNGENRLKQALNKGYDNYNKAKNENQEDDNSSKLDKISEKAVEQFGGKALTAATGGAVSGPAADAIAKTVAKPASKILKFGFIVTMVPLIVIVFFFFSIFIANHNMSEAKKSSSDDNDTSENENNNGVCGYKVNGKFYTNVKVRLLQCALDGTRGEPIKGEELVDFEKYILGVTYAEHVGLEEDTKAQAVAARSYALMRPKAMGEKWVKYETSKDGTLILNLRNCVEDQVYCDPDRGCSKSQKSQWATMYSGVNTKSNKYHGPISQNSDVRKWVAKTTGEVALNKNGNIVNTDYTDTNQGYWNSLAKQGKNYFEILKKDYGSIVAIQSNCQSSKGEFTKWKQCKQSWSNINLGSSYETICSAGCAATSTAIQIAHSGTKVSIPKLNPGTFVQTLNKNGGFDNGGRIYWSKASVVAPKFKHLGAANVTGNPSQKATKLQNYINNGEYLVIGIHKTANDNGFGHWVALDKTSGNNVYIFDPGSSATKLFDEYPFTKTREVRVQRFKID